MSPRPRTLLVVLAALMALAWSVAARAQGTPQMQLQMDADTVGVGDVVHVQLGAQSSDAAPSDPRLTLPAGLAVRGQSTSPTQTHMNINGVQSDRYGLTVDWTVQTQRVGVFTIGPASITVGGARFAVRGATLHVVPAGQAPQRPAPAQPPPGSPFTFSPFDPWKGLLQGFGQNFPQPPDLQPPQSTQPLTTDPKLSLDAPRAAYYFLHATVDKTSAVVGEQVTFSVYEYIDLGAQTAIEVDDSDVHDATAADFVKHPLLREDQDALLAGYASIGGRTWLVKLVRRWALFPLHAGDLAIGPMSVMLARPRAAVGQRTTEALTVHVTEPPVAGRPPGYALGDVGHFSLTAQVNPRDVDQGGAVGVHVELSGTGNVPSTISTPAREGIEWLAPEVHEQLGGIGHENFGGKRTFDYVVRVRRSGDVSLGELSLPFWDPDAKRYDVARASLGVLHVKPVASAPAASADAPEETLPGLPPPVDTMEGEPARRAHLDDVPLFWLLGVVAWPVAFGLAVGATAAGRRVTQAWRTRSASPAAELKERLAAADAASEGSDARQVDAAVARALEAAAMAHAGVNVRGALGGEVAERLARAGVAQDAASRIADLLRECEMARFSPEGADVASARDRWIRARGAIRELERRA
ncbi:MAG TPA: BatD family protein [Polyangiaceae bacterium]|nr:BatD family protein [Polyangiaceae bacterium]